MTIVPPEIEFDPHDLALAADPFPVLATLRGTCPVAHAPAHGGFWVISRYEDVRHVALHPELFSSKHTSVPKDIGFGEDFCLAPVNLDPPEHGPAKQRLAPAFLPGEIATYEDVVREQITLQLDELVPLGRFDASADFAALLATGVLCRVLGLPGPPERIVGWINRLFGAEGTSTDVAHEIVGEAFLYLTEAIADRRASPQRDIVSQLITAEVEGEPMGDVEIMSTTMLLLFAGIETTWGTLAASIHHLATHPDDQRRLRDDPSLIEPAREEFLRAFAPVSPAREVVEDTVLGGQQLRAGDMVWLSISSANRDEDEFPDAGEVVLDRTPNRHLAFGTGIHRCLGVNIARLELRVALEELLRRVPEFRLSDPDAVRWTPGVTRGPRNVVIEFEPGAP